MEEVGMENKKDTNTEIGNKEKKKRGRKKKGEEQEKKEIKDKNKFIIDVTKDSEDRDSIMNVLRQANDKNYGREILLKDIVMILLPKMTSKELEKLQENSLSDNEKIRKAHVEFNKKNNVELSFNEFLIKRLGIN